jgi:hypothetical protein
MLKNYRVAAQLVASRVVLSSTELVSRSSFILTRAEWTLFQTHFCSENVVAPEIEPETSGFAARNCDQ